MSMMERIQQLAAAPKPKAEKPRIRVMALVGTTPATPSTTLPHDRGAHAVGHACPHCTGGSYFNHTKRTWGKCFRCHGKGVLDTRDMEFYTARKEHGRPLCKVYGGVI